MLEFNREETDYVRISLSLRVDKDAMYYNLIEPARKARSLSKLIQDLLVLYYENEYVRDLLYGQESFDDDVLSYDEIMEQMNSLLEAQKEAANKSFIMQANVSGMNEYLEQQHEMLKDGLVGGLAENICIDTYGGSTRSTPLSAGQNGKSPDIITRLSTDMSALMSRVDELAASVAEKTQTDNRETKNSPETAFSAEIEDVSVNEYEENAEELPAAKNTHKQMRNASKKPRDIDTMTANISKLMAGMEKTGN